MKKRLTLILALLLVLALFSGCSAGSASTPMSASSQMSADNSYAAKSAEMPSAEYDAAEVYSDYGSGSESAVTRLAADAARKLIWTGQVSMETLDYDKSEQTLFALVEECGGYIESSSVGGGNINIYSGARDLKNGWFSVRVPAEKFQYFINNGSTVATVLQTSTSSSDVTDEYFDLEGRLDVLKIKEARLLEMLKADGELEYLLQLENELSDTRYEIESLTGTLRRYDGMITYATVSVDLQEVRKPTEISPPDPLTAGERIAARFVGSLKNIWEGVVEVFIFVIGYSPVLILLAAVITVAAVAIVRTGKKRRARKVPPAPPTQQPPENN